jgi:hypothetical protein
MGKSKGSKTPPPPMVGGVYTQNDIDAYTQELMGAPIAQSRAIPHAISLENQMLPMLQSHYFNTLGSTAGGLQDLYGSLRQGAVQNQGAYGSELINMYGSLGAGATNAAIAGLGADASRNYNLMQTQAADELALGTSLTQQETDIARGSARAAASARGLNFSRQGSDLEILNTYALGQQRQKDRRQFAVGALQAAQGMQEYGAKAYLNPALEGSSIYSIPGLIAGSEGAIGSFGPRVLQPESQYMSDLRTSRMQGQTAQMQADATRRAGQMSGIATLGAALITKFCWVAREVYGEDNPKWLLFREWMVTSSPDCVFEFYAKHGESIANFISDKPIAKRIIRFVMDMVIRRYENQLSKIYA